MSKERTRVWEKGMAAVVEVIVGVLKVRVGQGSRLRNRLVGSRLVINVGLDDPRRCVIVVFPPSFYRGY